MRQQENSSTKIIRGKGRYQRNKSGARMFMDAVLSIFHRGKVDRTYDIPRLAGYIRNGKIIYIDRHVLKTFTADGRRVSVDRFLILHEAIEKALIDKLGVHYEHARQIALHTEEAAVKSSDILPQEYPQFMQRYIKQVEDEGLRLMPLDPDLKPYRDEDDSKKLKSIQKLLKRETPPDQHRQVKYSQKR